MGFFDYIAERMRERQVAKTNVSRRGVTEYAPSQIGGFVEPDIYQRNVICSGDAPELRSELIVSLCVAATNAQVPVLVLHQGDAALCRQFHKIYQNHPAYVEVGPGGRHFDPLFQLSPDQISKMIVDTAPQKYALTCDGQAYIDVLTGFLTARSRQITLKGLYECPHARLPQLLSNAAGNQSMPPAVIQGLQTNLALGQKESHKVRAYFKELYDECYSLLPPDRSGYAGCVSIFQAISQGAVMNLDIISDTNVLLLKIIAEQIQMLIRRGVPFYVILDNIAIRDNNSMKAIGMTRSGRFACAIAGDDVFSLCDGDEKVFGAVLGQSPKWFVLRHNSGISAEKWSAAFSKYLKVDTSVNFGSGTGKGSGNNFSFGGGLHTGFGWNRNQSSQQGVTYTNRDEAVIRGEEIQRLTARSGYIYTAATGEIAHVGEFQPQ